MYRMLTGITPPESTNRIIEDTILDADQVNPSVPRNISSIIMRSLATERHLRFQSVDSFLHILEKGKKVRSPKKEKRHRRRVRFWGVLCSLSLLLAMGWMTFKYVSNKAIEEEAVLNDATISVWYCLEGSMGEEKAMEEVKKNFTDSYGNISIDLKAFEKDEYLNELQRAADAGHLPNLFESTDATTDILNKTQLLTDIYSSRHLDKTLFVKNRSLSQLRLPAAKQKRLASSWNLRGNMFPSLTMSRQS